MTKQALQAPAIPILDQQASDQSASTVEPAEVDMAAKKRAIETKWGRPNIAAGWTCIPNILVRRQQTLGIDSLDMNILLHLMTYWWEDEKHPHPSKETLAKAIGVSASTIQRRIRAMEAGGLLRRVERRREADRSETNLYDLTPLRVLLEPHAKEELEERKAGHTGRRERMTKVTKVKSTVT